MDSQGIALTNERYRCIKSLGPQRDHRGMPMKAKAEKVKRVRLTETIVKGLQPSEKQYSVADSEVVGLQIRVMPSGAKTYSVRCRLEDGGGLTWHWQRVRVDGRSSPRPRKGEGCRNPQRQYPNQIKRAARREKVNTFGGFIEAEYVPKHLNRCKSGGETLARLKACFEDTFWNKPLTDITPNLVANWVAGRVADGRANSTINRDVTCVKGVLTKAFKWGFLDTQPLHKRLDHLPEDRSEEPRYLTPDEDKRLMDALIVRQEKQRGEAPQP